jgi:hypothetical protein
MRRLKYYQINLVNSFVSVGSLLRESTKFMTWTPIGLEQNVKLMRHRIKRKSCLSEASSFPPDDLLSTR